MSQTYRAILVKDHVSWTAGSPDHEGPVDVYITVIDAGQSGTGDTSGSAMAAALQEIADRGGLSDVADASAWQREIRRDRKLPSRDQ